MAKSRIAIVILSLRVAICVAPPMQPIKWGKFSPFVSPQKTICYKVQNSENNVLLQKYTRFLLHLAVLFSQQQHCIDFTFLFCNLTFDGGNVKNAFFLTQGTDHEDKIFS